MFLHHEPCPRCGSKDNLGRYRDGSGWCFGCGYRERATSAPLEFYGLSEGPEQSSEVPRIPDDAGTNFAPHAVEWLAQYHLDVPTAIRRGVLYSGSRDQIIYQLGNVWQARNLRQGGGPGNSGRARSKNFTAGNVNECTHIYGHTSSAEDVAGLEQGVLVIVEDPVSAIRVAALHDAMPLLGSYLASSRLNAIARLYGAVIVYLDSDKLKEARGMVERFKQVGVDARTIWTELDPKCYTNEQLVEILK